MSDDSRKRTVRAQLTNGALEAKAYVEPRNIAQTPDAHRTFKMQKVEVDTNLDPRMRKTVARGQGEALAALEGDIVDPETGRVLPPVGADPNPLSPWKGGKRPTHVKLPKPDLRTAGSAGSAGSAEDAQPSRVVWLVAAAMVIAAVVFAVFVATRASRTASPTPAAPREVRTEAPRAPAEEASPPERAPVVAPTAEPAPGGDPSVAVPSGASSASAPGAVPPAAATSQPPPAGSARKGGRIF